MGFASLFKPMILASTILALGLCSTGCEPEMVGKKSVNPSQPDNGASPSQPKGKDDVGFEVSSFDRCAAAGGPIMESSPRQCSFGGKHFTEDLSIGKKGDTRTLVLRIQAQDTECTGAHGSRRCLIANGENFFDSIEGFRFKPGTESVIEVLRTQICDPKVSNDCPQDAGIYAYKLVRVIESFTQDNRPSQPEGDNWITFVGTITKVESGKDGYTVELSAADGQNLVAVLSIPNLGPDSQFDFGSVKVGTKIEVQGEPFMLGERRRMAAKRARVVQ